MTINLIYQRFMVNFSYLIFLFFITTGYVFSNCLEEEIEINEHCVNSNRVHYVSPGQQNILQSLLNEVKPDEYIILKSGDYLIESTASAQAALVITGKHSVTLMGEEDTWLKTSQGEVAVLMVEASENITLQNLGLRHEVPSGRCEKPVIKLMNSKKIKISEVLMEGSGAQAINLENSRGIEITGGKARQNTEGVFEIKNSQDVTIKNMVIAENHNSGLSKKGILDIENSNGILFSLNVIKDNRNAYFKKVINSQSLEIEGNEFRNNNFPIYDLSETSPSIGDLLWSKSLVIHASLPAFWFEFMGTKENLKTIKIYHHSQPEQPVIKDAKPFQIIEGLDALPEGNYFRMEDINFDGYQDFRLREAIKGENPTYLVWLFHSPTGIFVKNQELSGIPAFTLDNDNKQVVAAWKSGANHYGIDYYQFIDEKATLVRQELKDYVEPGIYQLTVKELVGKEMTTLKPQLIREEEQDWVRDVWQHLDLAIEKAQKQKLCPGEMGDWPGVYCYVKGVVNYGLLRKFAKLPVFTEGPHSDTQLNLKANNAFGYYQKDFVKWLINHLIPTDEALQRSTQPLYERYFQKLARTFYEVYEKFQAEPDSLRKAKEVYLAQDRTSLLESLTGRVTAFWIRRAIDGTEQEWGKGLRRLLETYDPVFLTSRDDQTISISLQKQRRIADLARPYCQENRVLVFSSSLLQVMGYPTIKAALDMVYPGEVIWICPGLYPETIHISGRSHLTIYGESVQLVTASPTEALVTFQDSQYLEIAGLQLSLEMVGPASKCLKINNSDHIYVRNNGFESCGQTAIWLSHVQDAEITGNQLLASQQGLTVQHSSNLLLKYNRFLGNQEQNLSSLAVEESKVFKNNKWLADNEWHPSQKEQNDLFKIGSLTSQARQGDVLSQLMVSWYWNHEKDAESLKWLQQAAAQGFAKAQYQLGWRCSARRCQEYWFSQAARQGHLAAQTLLANEYFAGQRLPQDFGQAVYWARKAAQQGDAKSQNLLAGLYYEGKGVPQNFNLAAYWVRKAAQQGYAQAQYNLGELYVQGRGVPKDLNQAIEWFSKAAYQNYPQAQFRLGELNGCR